VYKPATEKDWDLSADQFDDLGFFIQVCVNQRYLRIYCFYGSLLFVVMACPFDITVNDPSIDVSSPLCLLLTCQAITPIASEYVWPEQTKYGINGCHYLVIFHDPVFNNDGQRQWTNDSFWQSAPIKFHIYVSFAVFVLS